MIIAGAPLMKVDHEFSVKVAQDEKQISGTDPYGLTRMTVYDTVTHFTSNSHFTNKLIDSGPIM